MTSLVGRMLRLFPESVPLEDLFTEAVARLFETRPELCVAWLREVGALPPGREAAGGGARVRTRLQKWLGNLDHREAASRVDLMIEVLWPPEGGAAGSAAPADVVVVESKVGSRPGRRRAAQALRGAPPRDGGLREQGAALRHPRLRPERSLAKPTRVRAPGTENEPRGRQPSANAPRPSEGPSGNATNAACVSSSTGGSSRGPTRDRVIP